MNLWQQITSEIVARSSSSLVAVALALGWLPLSAWGNSANADGQDSTGKTEQTRQRTEQSTNDQLGKAAASNNRPKLRDVGLATSPPSPTEQSDASKAVSSGKPPDASKSASSMNVAKPLASVQLSKTPFGLIKPAQATELKAETPLSASPEQSTQHRIEKSTEEASGEAPRRKQIAAGQIGKPSQQPSSSSFQNQMQTDNQNANAQQTQPQLRGTTGLPPVTMPPRTVRKLHIDMGDTIPSVNWRNPAGKAPSEAEERMNAVAAGMTPLKVKEALNEALLNSPRVAAARALLGIQKALYAGATQLPDPVYFRDEAPQSEGVRRNGPVITYEFPWKLAFRLLAAKRQVQETKTEILQTLWQFRNDVRRAYTEMVVAQETFQTLHDLADLALKLQVVSSKRFQAGDVPELDVLKARLAYSQADVDAAQGNMRVNRARQQLNVIMGRQYSSPVSAPRLPPFELKAEKTELLPDYSVPVPPVTDFIAEAMENRIELKTNAAQIRLTKAQLLNAAGNILPNPSIAYGGSTETNLPSGPKLNGLFTTINMEAPLYTFSQGDIARLRATLRQFKAQEAAIRNQIIADVTAAYNNLITARNRIQTYQDHVLADSAEVARLARRSYEVGQSDITATLAAQQANFQVRQAYLDAVSSYQQAFTDLEQSIGEPID